MDPLKIYFLLKMGIFQPAMLVFQRLIFSIFHWGNEQIVANSLPMDAIFQRYQGPSLWVSGVSPGEVSVETPGSHLQVI